MKLTIYHIVEDAECGTKCELFGSRQAQLARQKQIIEADLKRPGEDTNTERVKQLLEADDISAAWDLWQDKCKDSMDLYDVSSQEVEVHSQAFVELLTVLRSIECRMTRWRVTGIAAGPKGLDKDWDDLLQQTRTAIAFATHQS